MDSTKVRVSLQNDRLCFDTKQKKGDPLKQLKLGKKAVLDFSQFSIKATKGSGGLEVTVPKVTPAAA